VIETARHLLALIDEVLDLAKVGAGHVELKIEPIDLEEVLDLAVDQVTPLAHAKGLSLERRVAGGPVTALTDGIVRGLIRQGVPIR
jgi:signal transduction histidine kinase